MIKTSFYTDDELKEMGFKSVGKKVLISRNAKFYGALKVEIGDNVRIDDFCILSGYIKLGSHIHIAAGTYLFAGDAGIEMEDFTCLSGKCNVYAVSDDYLGEALTNSTIPDKFKKITEKKVLIKKHSLVGAGSTVLPGVTIEEGCSFGSMSLVNKSTTPWGVYFDVPAKRVKDRKKDLLKLEQDFLNEWNKENG